MFCILPGLWELGMRALGGSSKSLRFRQARLHSRAHHCGVFRLMRRVRSTGLTPSSSQNQYYH